MSRIAKAAAANPRQKPIPGPTFGPPALGDGSTSNAPVVMPRGTPGAKQRWLKRHK